MESHPKISIVTPCYNSATHLEAAILSLLNQGYPNLEYIIIDGGSTDGTVDVIKKYERHLHYWCSERDNGMYHALQKGFDKSSGEIMGWLNADDIHHPGSLSIIAQIFGEFPKVNWIQGTPSMVDEQGRIVYAAPREYIDRFFFYQKKHLSTKLYIQQESTFWRRTLWAESGSFISTEYKYAADFDLWIRFFNHARLFLVPALLGGFRTSSNGQLSTTHAHEYEQETLKSIESNPLSPELKRTMWLKGLIDIIGNRFEISRRLAAGLMRGKRSVVPGAIRFDRTSQRFKFY